MKSQILSMNVGVPLTQRSIEQNPDLLVTPSFAKFLSLHHSFNGTTTFACQSCRGAIRYKKTMLMPLCNIAYCTSIRDDTSLRLQCLNFIRECEPPIVGTVEGAPSSRSRQSGTSMD